jgi:hypothetical protein
VEIPEISERNSDETVDHVTTESLRTRILAGEAPGRIIMAAFFIRLLASDEGSDR